MLYIGVDPGKNGAIASISELSVEVVVCPMIGKEYDTTSMASLLKKYSEKGCTATIERVHAMPHQGGTSMLSIGYGFGLWIGMFAALSIPYVVIPAVKWQKNMLVGLGKVDKKTRKQASIVAASRLFPGVSLLATPRCKTQHDGMAEAILIAEYGKRIRNGSDSTSS
jgi:hypothetical protein